MGETFHTILVPQGAEFQAVCRGLKIAPAMPKLRVLPMPVGTKPVTRYLGALQKTGRFSPQSRVLLMGLCGSLTPYSSTGDIVLYQGCIYRSDLPPLLEPCNLELTAQLKDNLKEKVTLVKGLTSDTLVCFAQEKRQLGQIFDAAVVDMEGFATLKFLSQANVAVAIIRVVSDDSYQDLPNLNSAFSVDGSIQFLPLAIGLLRQPVAGMRLIRGSLQSLSVLQKLAESIAQIPVEA